MDGVAVIEYLPGLGHEMLHTINPIHSRLQSWACIPLLAAAFAHGMLFFDRDGWDEQQNSVYNSGSKLQLDKQ
eukprot:1160535-Pelagomonas_calceolata.AAC.8